MCRNCNSVYFFISMPSSGMWLKSHTFTSIHNVCSENLFNFVLDWYLVIFHTMNYRADITSQFIDW